MDEKSIRRAALITLRRAILKRLPAGRERSAWLRWLRAQKYCAAGGEGRGGAEGLV